MEPVEVSVVMPCLNEEKAIGICIRTVKEVFAREKIRGEIIVADNGSTDSSCRIVESEGVRLVREPQRGYGAAYLCGLNQARGAYIVIADSDNTYDFNDIPVFLKLLCNGYDFVIGSRFKGVIHKGAMPWAHRYIGNPLLSAMTRLFFRTRLSDIHCGMRAFTRDAFLKMRLYTAGMEFATEMVVSAIVNNLKIGEVPIHYFPRQGVSKLKALTDAWRHIRFMLLYCPSWLYFIPGLTAFVVGLLALLLLMGGPVLFLGHYWDIHMMILASMATILAYQLLHIGVYAHTFAIEQGFIQIDRLNIFLQRHFSLERGLLIGLACSFLGFTLLFSIFLEWFRNNFGPLYRIRETVLSMTMMIIGLQTIFSSFFISLLSLRKK